MLGCNHAIRSPTLSRQWRRSLPQSFCRSFHYSPPSSSKHKDHETRSAGPSGSLPVSPFLDQKVVDAKRKLNFDFKKLPQKAADLTDFQKRLAVNPYAHALATPVRSCALSNAKLPQHFLLPFATQFDVQEASGRPVPYITLKTSKTLPGPKTAMLNSRSLLKSLGRKKAWQRLISRDMQDRFRINDKREWSWPDGVERLVMQQLRDAVLVKLKWAFDMPGAKLVRTLDVDPDDACWVLVLKDSAKPGVKATETPTFNLPSLLGDEVMEELVQGTKFANVDAVALANSSPTTSVRTQLLRLRDFLDDNDNKRK